MYKRFRPPRQHTVGLLDAAYCYKCRNIAWSVRKAHEMDGTAKMAQPIVNRFETDSGVLRKPLLDGVCVDIPREGSRRCALWPNYIERLFTLSDFIFESKGSRYSITERRVPEPIPVIGSQPAGDVSHEPGGRLLYVTFHQACSYPRNS